MKKLSDKEHYTDLDNDNKFEHNSDYDHEAFLGKDEADSFKTLTPEESKLRLGYNYKFTHFKSITKNVIFSQIIKPNC